MNPIAQRIQDAYNATEPLTPELALAAMEEIIRLEQRNEEMANEYWRLKSERDMYLRMLNQPKGNQP